MSKRPNILFLFSDQQRWDTCGAYGQPLPVTPNLDQMAKEGALFEHCYTPQPVCGPARAILQTGMYASQCGVPTNGRPLPTEFPLLAPQLSEAGYHVGYLGKWHLASKHNSCYQPDEKEDYRNCGVPEDKRGGYKDYWLAADALEHTSHSYDGHMWDMNNNKIDFPENRFRADVVTDWLLDYLGDRADAKKSGDDQPFFMMCSWIEPHHQNDHHCYEGPKGSKEQWKNFVAPGDLAPHKGVGDWEKEYPDYLGCVHNLDYNVGRIRAALEQQGLAEDTIVIYTTDHGSHFRTRNAEYKRSPHAASTHIPLFICGPGIEPGTRIEDMVSLIDLPATFVDYAGGRIPESFQGQSLKVLLDGDEHESRDHVYIELSESHFGRAVRTKDWCYAVENSEVTPFHSDEVTEYSDACLYDLNTDPHEQNNLIEDSAYQAQRDEMAVLLGKLMKQHCNLDVQLQSKMAV